MVAILSATNGFQVLESTYSLPAFHDHDDEDEDLLLGVEIAPGTIALDVGGVANGRQFHCRFSFAGQDDGFTLATLTTVLWDTATGTAERHRFDYPAGEHASIAGIMIGDAFTPKGVEAVNLFEPEAFADCLETFIIDGFPVTWEAFVLYSESGNPTLETHTAYIFCSACGESFYENQDFREHACDARSGDGFACAGCGSLFDSESSLYDHHCDISSPETITCGACGDVFHEPSQFAVHVCITFPMQGLVYCDLCGLSFEEGMTFRDHYCAEEQLEDASGDAATGTAGVG